jgi:hypothetical protein
MLLILAVHILQNTNDLMKLFDAPKEIYFRYFKSFYIKKERERFL